MNYLYYSNEMVINMLKKIKYIYISILFLLSLPQITSAQTCGFGCLGLSGFYVGYSFENYQADGLNYQLNKDLGDMGINNQQYNFRSGQGFRFGMNIVRARYERYFFTVKGYYQFLKEEQSVIALSPGKRSDLKSKFEMNNWALGFDFGIPLVNFMDWKIVNGSIKFFNTQLTNQVVENNNVVQEIKYTIPEITVGFSVGTGLVIHIIENYVSIEGTGLYNFTKIDYLINSDDSHHFPEEGSKVSLVNNGGFSGIVQINIGIPL